MRTNIKRRNFIRIISFSLAAVLVIAGAAISGFGIASRYRTTIEYGYHRALNQLSDYVSTIESTLTKGVYANTASQQYGLASKLMVNSESAKNALSQLPLSENEEASLQKYLTQVGDFSTYSIGMLSRGKNLSEDNIKALDALVDYAKKVSPVLEEISAKYSDGSDMISREEGIKGNLEKDGKIVEKQGFENSFVDVNENFVDYPSLIYDGPFADQVQQKTPRMTKNADGFSVEDARQRAAQFLNIEPTALEYKESRKGILPVYIFTGDDIYISVTIKGGYVAEMYDKSEQSGNNNFDFKALTEKTKAFLKQRKMDRMKESYFVTADDVCTINYSYQDENREAVCYSDLIKIGASTKSGKVVTYNATGYIMNHMDRKITGSKLSLEEARESISKRLTIETSQVAMIPTGGSDEVLCYEFTCKGQKDDRVIVYINGDTGLEEQIFILLQSDGGTLVM